MGVGLVPSAKTCPPPKSVRWIRQCVGLNFPSLVLFTHLKHTSLAVILSMYFL